MSFREDEKRIDVNFGGIVHNVSNIDKTLSVEGAAAEAKTVGDKIAELREIANSNKERIETLEQNGSTIIVDEELSKTSTNPVQNKVVAEKIEEVEEKIENISVDVTTDKTLTQENTPADAKAVGEELTKKINIPSNFPPTAQSVVYFEKGETTPKLGNCSNSPLQYNFVRWRAGGRLQTNAPEQNLDCANKKYVGDMFNGANKAVSFINYSAMITALNSLSADSYAIGQNVMIVTLKVPDLWVSAIEETQVSCTYTTDEEFVSVLSTNGSVQVGYFKLSALETQKVDLTDYSTQEWVAEQINAAINGALEENY